MCGGPSTHIYIKDLVCVCRAHARLQHRVVLLCCLVTKEFLFTVSNGPSDIVCSMLFESVQERDRFDHVSTVRALEGFSFAGSTP